MRLWSYCKCCAEGGHGEGPLIRASGVRVCYSGVKEVALDGVDLEVKRGECVLVEGGNGAGKSTLLKVLGGVVPVFSGEIEIMGVSVREGMHRHKVLYVPQVAGINWDFPVNVKEFVMGGRYIYRGWLGRESGEDRRIGGEGMRLMGLGGLEGRLIGQLSVGQKQRLMLARALAHDPEIYLMDEPFNAVDKETQAVLNGILRELKGRGKTVVLTTHDYVDRLDYVDVRMRLDKGKLDWVERYGKLD